MPSLELFVNNIKKLLESKGWRVRDLSAYSGISASYLSQVLSGTKHNVSDDYKDRISSALGVSMAGLYSDTPLSGIDDFFYVGALRPEREELKGAIDTLLIRTGLEDAQPAFRAACGSLDDKDARVVKRYVMDVIGALSLEPKRPRALPPLSPDQTRLLSYCWLAGSGSKEQWIREISGLDHCDFRDTMQALASSGYIHLIEEAGTTRVRIDGEVPSVPLASMFSQKGLVATNLALAAAMHAFPDEGVVFQSKLASVLVKAGRYSEAHMHLRNASEMLEQIGHWYPAAELWQRAAVVAGASSDDDARIRYLCETARCIAKAGDLELSDLLGQRADSLVGDRDQTSPVVAFVFITMGNAFQSLDLNRSLKWYNRGLSRVDERSVYYGRLLVSIASAQLQLKRTCAAEQSLASLGLWLTERGDIPEVSHFRLRSTLLRGLVSHQKQEWDKSRASFNEIVSHEADTKVIDADVGVAWHGLGLLDYYDDKCQDSKDCLHRAETVFESLGLHRQLEALYVDLAKVAIREGCFQEAEQLLSRSEHSPYERAWVLFLRACIAKGRGHMAKAVSIGRQAIEEFSAKGLEDGLACANLWLSRVLQYVGDLPGARFYENWAFSIYGKKQWDVKRLYQQLALLNRKDA